MCLSGATYVSVLAAVLLCSSLESSSKCLPVCVEICVHVDAWIFSEELFTKTG